ncbi:MAG: 6-phosphogluconolactonase [Flavobacteriales bacterium]|jgi:6-phosphogluconolactonase
MNQTEMMIKRTFPNSTSLDQAFAKCIAEALIESIASNGETSILFSGGSTPIGLFGELAKEKVEWKLVKVGLVDDRIVPANSEHSNNKLLSDNFLELLQEDNRPEFFPLVTHPFNAANNLDYIRNSYDKFGVPDVVVLGMGGDGHFASLFPSDRASEVGLLQLDSPKLLNTIAPAPPKFRISFSWGFLRKAKHVFVHVTGKSKLELIEEQQSRSEPLPIDYVLTDSDVEPIIYWAPKN